MTETLWQAVIYGDPRQKKNNGRIIRIGGRPRLIPSKAYTEYEKTALPQVLEQNRLDKPIDEAVNVKCVYYMQTRRRVDVVNLLEATLDILVKGGIIEDDNYKIVQSMDGSRVEYCKEDPRVEIMIEKE